MSSIENVRNPFWANAGHTVINCEIEHSQYGWIPFTASQADHEEHGRTIFAACEAGEFGQVGDFVPPPVVVTSSVQMRQARLALLDIGLLDDVDAAIAGIADTKARKEAQIEWEFSPIVKRDSALIAQLAPGLGLTDTQLDALFTQAATL